MKALQKLVVVTILFFTIAAGASPDSRVPVVVDTDMAPDDWAAILYLLKQKEVDLKAITVTGTGEAHCDHASGDLRGAWNALALIHLSGQSSSAIEVACGQNAPVKGNHVFPQVWRDNSDTMFGIRLPRGLRAPFPGAAFELLEKVLEDSPVRVRILALGPLTNLGNLLSRRPDLGRKIERIVIMGGAVHVPGNIDDPGSPVRDNLVAEWNIYVDPRAANVVLGSGVPIQLVALDGTRFAPVTMSFLDKVGKAGPGASSQFIFSYLSRETDFIKTGKFFFWDPMAAAVLMHPDLCQFELNRIEVIEEEGPLSGQTRPALAGTEVSVCTYADGSRFERLFLQSFAHAE